MALDFIWGSLISDFLKEKYKKKRTLLRGNKWLWRDYMKESMDSCILNSLQNGIFDGLFVINSRIFKFRHNLLFLSIECLENYIAIVGELKREGKTLLWIPSNNNRSRESIRSHPRPVDADLSKESQGQIWRFRARENHINPLEKKSYFEGKKKIF